MAVLVSDDKSFKDQISGNDKVIVKYYADWCGSCKLFSPKYKRISGDEKFKDILFLDVNAENNPDARRMGEVKNLPSFAIFKNGQLLESLATSKEEALLELIQKLN
jgi:thioredoxin 1